MKARITSPLLYNPQWLPLVGIICVVMRRWSQDDDAERENHQNETNCTMDVWGSARQQWKRHEKRRKHNCKPPVRCLLKKEKKKERKNSTLCNPSILWLFIKTHQIWNFGADEFQLMQLFRKKEFNNDNANYLLPSSPCIFQHPLLCVKYNSSILEKVQSHDSLISDITMWQLKWSRVSVMSPNDSLSLIKWFLVVCLMYHVTSLCDHVTSSCNHVTSIGQLATNMTICSLTAM